MLGCGQPFVILSQTQILLVVLLSDSAVVPMESSFVIVLSGSHVLVLTTRSRVLRPARALDLTVEQ